jgi:nucleoside-diphosphate-sugar epimerase
MMRKILITGGAGFIGLHLARYLLKGNVQIVLADNLQRGRADKDFQDLIANPKVNFINMDLTDANNCNKLGGDYDHVYHLAAINGTANFYKMPHEVLRINVLSLLNMLEWHSKENKEGKFCFTSSNEAYAGALNSFGKLLIPTPENVPLVIEDTYNPRWSYGASKLAGELFVIHYAKMHNFRALVVRPHNFFGPRAGYEHVIPEFAMRIARREDPFQIKGADDTRTFCYIEDAVRAMQMLMDSEKTDRQPIETVHIGNTDEITIQNLAEKMFNIEGWKPEKLDVLDSLPGSVKRRCADITKIQKLTGWEPAVSLEEGLKKTMEWYRTHPKK